MEDIIGEVYWKGVGIGFIWGFLFFLIGSMLTQLT